MITQPMTFVATCNALYHIWAEPVFVDVSRKTLGLCPKTLSDWLEKYAQRIENGCIHKVSSRHLRGVVPMHTFGHPVEMDQLQIVCLFRCSYHQYRPTSTRKTRSTKCA